MKIRIDEIEESGRSLDFPEELGELNELLSRSEPADYRFTKPADVHVSYYRCGEDLMFDGRFTTTVQGTCSRCLEPYPFDVDLPFAFVLKPAPGHVPAASKEEGDRALDFYSGEEVDLSPLLREQILLSLPTRPLCREDCPGLCTHCGRNLKTGSCDCSEEWLDPRLAPLRSLKLRH